MIWISKKKLLKRADGLLDNTRLLSVLIGQTLGLGNHRGSLLGPPHHTREASPKSNPHGSVVPKLNHCDTPETSSVGCHRLGSDISQDPRWHRPILIRFCEVQRGSFEIWDLPSRILQDFLTKQVKGLNGDILCTPVRVPQNTKSWCCTLWGPLT